MPLAVDLTDLISYTSWQRGKWHALLRQHEDVLRSSAGPNGDGRFTTIGDLVKHIFFAEKRYVDRLSNRPLTDPASIPSDDVIPALRRRVVTDEQSHTMLVENLRKCFEKQGAY
jgi:hypothetical protein